MSVFVKIISYKNLKDSGLISFDFPATFSVKQQISVHYYSQKFFMMEIILTIVRRAVEVNFVIILLKEV